MAFDSRLKSWSMTRGECGSVLMATEKVSSSSWRESRKLGTHQLQPGSIRLRGRARAHIVGHGVWDGQGEPFWARCAVRSTVSSSVCFLVGSALGLAALGRSAAAVCLPCGVGHLELIFVVHAHSPVVGAVSDRAGAEWYSRASLPGRNWMGSNPAKF